MMPHLPEPAGIVQLQPAEAVKSLRVIADEHEIEAGGAINPAQCGRHMARMLVLRTAADTIEALLKERDDLQAVNDQHESALAAAWGRADSDRTLADFWARSAHTNKELREAAEAERDALKAQLSALQGTQS